MKKKTLSQALHETAKDLFEAGVIDEKTMREFDTQLLPPIKNLNQEYSQKNKAD